VCAPFCSHAALLAHPPPLHAHGVRRRPLPAPFCTPALVCPPFCSRTAPLAHLACMQGCTVTHRRLPFAPRFGAPILPFTWGSPAWVVPRLVCMPFVHTWGHHSDGAALTFCHGLHRPSVHVPPPLARKGGGVWAGRGRVVGCGNWGGGGWGWRGQGGGGGGGDGGGGRGGGGAYHGRRGLGVGALFLLHPLAYAQRGRACVRGRVGRINQGLGWHSPCRRDWAAALSLLHTRLREGGRCENGGCATRGAQRGQPCKWGDLRKGRCEHVGGCRNGGGQLTFCTPCLSGKEGGRRQERARKWGTRTRG